MGWVKVVCVKLSDLNPPFKNTLKIDEIYEARCFSELNLSNGGPGCTPPDRFYFLNLKNYPKILKKTADFAVKKDNFITLAEYREKQINTILDENDVHC